jgi:hypothetical protein
LVQPSLFRMLKSTRECRIGCCGFCAYQSPTGVIRQWPRKLRRQVQRVIGGFKRSEIARLLRLSARAMTFNVDDLCIAEVHTILAGWRACPQWLTVDPNRRRPQRSWVCGARLRLVSWCGAPGTHWTAHPGLSPAANTCIHASNRMFPTPKPATPGDISGPLA